MKKKQATSPETIVGVAKIVGVAMAPLIAWSQAGASLELGAVLTAVFLSIVAGAGAVSLWFSKDPRQRGELELPKIGGPQ